MKWTWSQVREVFEELLDASPANRERRLGELDAELAGEVRKLLSHDSEGQFLERAPGVELEALAKLSSPPRVELSPGLRIAGYELVRLIGTGGMGTVWEARQEVPRRRVALKMLLPSRQRWRRAEVWRFEYEAQVLANLRHPGIAQVYETGSTTVGEAEVLWIAMELVEGARDLLSWVRDRGTPRTQRLILFESLCDAVQHGHRHGVIHRDLKPSNVLVTEEGGVPRLKLIDFGIARAVNGGQETPSLRTRTGELLGTLEYMAPEQVEGRTDLDVRCDVYALGVVLYELLCDAPPLELTSRTLPEIAQRILRDEPKPPSRHDPSLAGDLESIVLLALEKDRTRRYAGAADLAADLRRYRNDAPVTARPASAAYRLLKFVRRNRVLALLVLAIGLGLFATTVGTTWGLFRARAAARLAEREAEWNRGMVQLLTHVLEGVDTSRRGRETRVVEMLRTADLDWSPLDGLDPELAFTFHRMMGRAYENLGWEPEALPHLERALELADRFQEPLDERELLRVRARLGLDMTRAGRAEEGADLLRTALQDATRLGDPRTRLFVARRHAVQLADRKRWVPLVDEAEHLIDLAAACDDDRERLAAMELLAFALSNLGRSERALELQGQVLEERTERFGEKATSTLDALASLADAEQVAGRFEEAEGTYRRARPLFLEVLGPESRRTLELLGNEVALLIRLRRLDEALPRASELVELYATGEHANSIGHAVAVQNLGMLHNLAGRHAEAEPLLRRSWEMARALLPSDDLQRTQMRFNLGACLAWMRRFDEGELQLLEAYETLESLLPADHPILQQAVHTLEEAYAHNGHPDEAAVWRQRRAHASGE